MDSFVGKSLINRDGERFSAVEVLETKQVFILLFASSSCKGIKDLIDLLKDIYKEAFKHRCGFEIILISSEKTATDFDYFFRRMCGPWYAIPFEDLMKTDSQAEELRMKFGISHIPFIVVVKPDGSYISRNALNDLETMGLNVIVAWSE
ncbi:nucleoredoxin-like protein 2 [Harmonia axyridis]|uniref:nucleoredoxin-like protein 2 n=1 Tax=Harmonia axyridis TaxID=115357 RepID=UPI001E27928B|nr:nucleoredoxin-like protein 2 [Harmonia axyridis]XP_045465650.1 nucleoredoxin-like protein 2 [Harmonia axyridis]XP_045465664.1 nucleoredoxin-like protein 2 [Harmonia axyridis]